MTGTDAHYEPPPVFGFAVSDTVTLNGTGDAIKLPVPGAVINLPSAGTYDVWADIHGGLVATEPPTDEQIQAELWNMSAGPAAPIPGSQTQVVALTNWNDDPAGGPVDAPVDVHHTAQATASLRMPITVTGPTTIQLHAWHLVGHNFNTPGDPTYGATLSAVGSDAISGATRIGYLKLN